METAATGIEIDVMVGHLVWHLCAVTRSAGFVRNCHGLLEQMTRDIFVAFRRPAVQETALCSN